MVTKLDKVQHFKGDLGDGHVEISDPSTKKSWLSNRTNLEKGLIIICLICFAITIAMVVIVAQQPLTSSANLTAPDMSESANQKRHSGDNICLSKTCVKTSARLLGSMDPEQDPCDDFFQYACGAWNKEHIIPDDRSSFNTFAQLKDELEVILKDLLERPISANDTLAESMARKLFKSCMNESYIETRHDEPAKMLIADLGGWPVLDAAWDSTDFDWVALTVKLRMYNNRPLINQWVSSDDKNSTVNIIQLDQARLGMPSRDYYLKDRDDNMLKAYENFAVNVAMLLGAQRSQALPDMREMIDLEIKLANITVPDTFRRDTESLYNRITVAELQRNISGIDWLRYLNLMFNQVNITITENHYVVIYAPVHLKNLVALINNTPPRTVANYLIWRIMMNRVGNLPKEFIDLRTEFYKVLHGTASDRSRWRTCVAYANDNFGMSVGRMFVREHFDETAKSDALEMVNRIRKSFTDLLNEVPWLDEENRAVAKEKADAIQEKIGYPQYILNETSLNKDYWGLKIDSSRYFENVIMILQYIARENLKNLNQVIDKTKWSTTPVVVNAFYSSTKNQIMFPAGILQPPFYHKDYPKSMNFGGIGMVIGHEITHGFDDRGRQFDKHGNLKQWWSDNTITKFKGKAKCIIEQYGNFTVEEVGLNLNGVQTQGENIADNGGLKQAFRAYQDYVKYVRKGKEEPLLPGLSLTHNQIFFLNFAQIWCGTARRESYISSIRAGRHSPGRFRVIGSLSNSRDFAKAYHCPLGSRMNPRHKCVVW